MSSALGCLPGRLRVVLATDVESLGTCRVACFRPASWLPTACWTLPWDCHHTGSSPHVRPPPPPILSLVASVPTPGMATSPSRLPPRGFAKITTTSLWLLRLPQRHHCGYFDYHRRRSVALSRPRCFRHLRHPETSHSFYAFDCSSF